MCYRAGTLWMFSTGECVPTCSHQRAGRGTSADWCQCFLEKSDVSTNSDERPTLNYSWRRRCEGSALSSCHHHRCERSDHTQLPSLPPSDLTRFSQHFLSVWDSRGPHGLMGNPVFTLGQSDWLYLTCCAWEHCVPPPVCVCEREMYMWVSKHVALHNNVTKQSFSAGRSQASLPPQFVPLWVSW